MKKEFRQLAQLFIPKFIKAQARLQSRFDDLTLAYSELAKRQQKLELEFQDKSFLQLRYRANLVRVLRNIGRYSKREHHSAAHVDLMRQRELLASRFPNAFPIWMELFENARAEYERSPLESLSVEGNPGASAFKEFLSVYAHGSILDIGCGPQRLPVYLKNVSADRIAGIDPLIGDEKRDFEFVQSHAEFLPWPDGEFDIVTAATSLDHVLSLDLALSEIWRVLRPGGYFILWVGFVHGAPAYDPSGPIKPIDQYHLFHFDRPWFLRAMSRNFDMVEEFSFDVQSHFYCFSK